MLSCNQQLALVGLQLRILNGMGFAAGPQSSWLRKTYGKGAS